MKRSLLFAVVFALLATVVPGTASEVAKNQMERIFQKEEAPGVWVTIYQIGDTTIGHVGSRDKTVTLSSSNCNPLPNCAPEIPDADDLTPPEFELNPDSLMVAVEGIPIVNEAAARVLRDAYQASGRNPQLTETIVEKYNACHNGDYMDCDDPRSPEVYPPSSLPSLPPTPSQTSEDSHMFDDGCIWIDGKAYWQGCYSRFRVEDSDPNNWHLADEGRGTGHGKGYAIKTGRVGFRHRSGGGEEGRPHTITKFSPNRTLYGDQHCLSQTIGLSAFGLSMSETTPVCIDKITIKYDIQGYFRSQWNNGGGSRGEDVATTTQSFAKIPNADADYWTMFIYVYSMF